jgi:hypothetical protein
MALPISLADTKIHKIEYTDLQCVRPPQFPIAAFYRTNIRFVTFFAVFYPSVNAFPGRRVSVFVEVFRVQVNPPKRANKRGVVWVD